MDEARWDCQSIRDLSNVLSFFGLAAAAKLDKDFRGFAAGFGLVGSIGAAFASFGEGEVRTEVVFGVEASGVGAEDADVREVFATASSGGCLLRHCCASGESSATSIFSLKYH